MREELISVMETLCGNNLSPFLSLLGVWGRGVSIYDVF